MSQGGTDRAQERAFKRELLDKLRNLQSGPFDVLVLDLPREVIENPQWFAEAQEGARQIGEAARKAVVLLPEGTKLTSQDVMPFIRHLVEEKRAEAGPDIALPRIELPPELR